MIWKNKHSEEVRSERHAKGRSILETLSSYVVIDLETTGLDPSYDGIIEVAGLRVIEGTVAERFSSLVNPGFVNATYGIPRFITELTGITNEMLLDAPRASEIIPKYLDFIGDSVVVAHNANFDVNFLYDLCVYAEHAHFSNDFIDTMRMSRRLFSEHRRHRLIDLVERFNISGCVEHRALSDAMKTHLCYEYMNPYAPRRLYPLLFLYREN